MNISSIDQSLPGSIDKSGGLPLTEVRDSARQENGVRADLRQITDGAGLSALAPRIQAVLNEIAGPEDNVLDALGNNVNKLQDGFIETLYTSLSSRDIDLSQKLTLRLDGEGLLSVAGDHPQKEAVDELLREQPALSAAFDEIASQSELLRDIRNISKVVSRKSGVDQYAALGNAGSAVYQMSLKGDMSHFYFSRS